MTNIKAFSALMILMFSVIAISLSSSLQSVSAANITGTRADEHLIGTHLHDYISGQGGNDFIEGLAGPDSLYGRDGNDRLEGGQGFDKLSGGKGNDQLIGGLGNDIFFGRLGADSFDCGPGNDTIIDFSVAEGDTKTDDCENIVEPRLVIWYDAYTSYDFGAQERLRNQGMIVENRIRSGGIPVSNLGAADLVIIDSVDLSVKFSADEVTEFKNYVNGGGRLVFTVDTHYFYCDPPSTCPYEVTRDFGFAFGGDIQGGPAVPADGQSGHPIWTSPNSISSFKDWCCDGYVAEIIDTTNVKVLGIIDGPATSVTAAGGSVTVTDAPAIVINENPAFNGGKVMGTGTDIFVGLGSDYRMFDNIIKFMLS